MREVQFYKNLTRKTTFLRGGLGSTSIIWDWKRVKSKSQNVLGANSCVCRSFRRKTGKLRGSFCPQPFLDGVKSLISFDLRRKAKYDFEK